MKLVRWIVPSILMLATGAGVSAQTPSAVPKAAPPAPPAPAGTLIARSVLFGNPERVAPRLSPDGTRLAYLAPVDGVMNILVGPVDNPGAAKPVTRDKGRGIQTYFWAYNNTHILYTQDSGGDENWKVYAVDVATGDLRDLTPFETIPGPDGKPITRPKSDIPLRPAAQIQQVSPRFPDEILIGLNNRNPMFHDIHRVNVKTGAMTLVARNDRFMGMVSDDDYNVRLAVQAKLDGGMTHYRAAGGDWAPFQEIGFEDAMTTQPVGFNKDGTVVYMIDTRDRNTAAFTSVDLATGAATVVAEDAKADAGGAMIHPTTYKVEAVSFNYLKNEWKVLDKAIQADLDYLKSVWPGEVAVADRTHDDAHWVVAYAQDVGAVRYYHYDRSGGQKKATFLFSARPALDGVELAPMHPVVITARDGLELVSYLTLPVGTDTDGNARPERPLPLVLNVHGGPWARDAWGYRGDVQWLANRGYAVLQVNFRGSTGFGKAFLNAADREWGAKMQDDLTDAVNWAVNEKIADAGRVAIYGGSYGGYAVLAGMTFTPDLFACGVDIVGVANLNTFIKSIPPYWAPFLEQIKRRVGDFSTEEGQKFLASRSPVNFVQNIKRPLLIAQGANDPRVNKDESDQVVAAMKKKNIPVTYVLYEDEGHGFQRPENRMSFFAVSEAFLAEHLGGKYEPIDDDFKGSSLKVPEGASHVPGLSDAIPSK